MDLNGLVANTPVQKSPLSPLMGPQTRVTALYGTLSFMGAERQS
jgi:hypothetical protein